jgi:PAS domain S-box-containing protein
MARKYNTKTIPKSQETRLPGFLAEGGETAKIIQAFDWSLTSLGPIETWPQSMRTAVTIALRSPLPIVTLWGKDGIMIYNDAYSAFAGPKHPALLGSKVIEGWPEVASFNRNVMAKGLKGKSFSYKGQRLTLYRNNKPEDVRVDVNYSPIVDEHGKPAGVMSIVVETTQRVQASRKREQAEDALQAERKPLHDLFTHAPAIVAVMRGPEHTYELANPRYMQIIGNRPVLGKTIRQALPELAGQGVYEVYDEAFRTGKPSYGNEVPVKLDKSGKGTVSQCYFNFVYQPYFDDDDQVEGILVHAVDVSDQVIARKEVEAQNEVLKMIASGASLKDTLEFLILSIEKQSDHTMVGSILLVDNTGKHLRHGAAPSLPREYNEMIDGIDIGQGIGSCGTAAFTKGPVIVADPLWHNFKDAAKKHGLQSCWSTPILSSRHNVLGTFAMYYDKPHTPSQQDRHIVDFVTRTAALVIERKKAEEAIIDSEERFRFMAETLPLKIFTTTSQGRVTYFNPQWSEYTGVPMEQLLKDRVLKFLHPDDLEESMESWHRAIKDGGSFENEQRLRRFDGQYRRHVSSVRAMRDSSGKIVSWFGSMTDIEDVLQTTVQKEKLEITTAALKEQRTQLLAINKVKDEFIALSSHQLRTPATAVKQYISLVLDGYFGPITTKQKRSLQTAYDSNERQLNVIKDLLKTAQLDSSSYMLNKEYRSILDLIKESALELQTYLELKGQSVAFESEADNTKLLVDYSEMKLVFVNLLENAIKYSYPGSSIRIRVYKKNEHLEVEMRDEGVGISKEDTKRIFDKFTRIDNELSDTVNGTGLGLYWVKRIVRLHRGTIKVKSTLGRGSTFIVGLPI